MSRCPVTVHWHDLDLDRRCIQPDGHEGLHRDGVWWFDNYGLRVPRDDDRRDPAERTAAAVVEAGR